MVRKEGRMVTSRLRFLGGTLLVGVLLGWVSAQAAGIPTPAELIEKYGLQPGLKITKENADLIKDLVPEVVYQRTKNGDYIFTIATFDPPDLLAKIWDQDYYDSTKRNAGKYDVDADGGIIDKATGQRPWPMPLGLPYPDIDLSEAPAKVGAKMMWNVASLAGTCGEQDHDGARLFSSPHSGGYDRYFVPKIIRQYVDFRRAPIGLQRPVIFQEIFFFNEPAD